jgi:diphosphomevalonate decarboxylase
MDLEGMKATASARSNIAIIKYWGMRDYSLGLPSNSSISFTMDDTLSTTTTVEFSRKCPRDSLSIDGRPAEPNETARASQFLNIVRKMAGVRMRAKIASRNTFPRSAGMASSASAFAALACAATNACGIKLGGKELSQLAMLGSGSASRSVFGGCVEWRAGAKAGGSDCYARQISKKEDWAHLRNAIAIVDSGKKAIGSREGMEITARTSELFAARLKTIGKRIAEMKGAVARRDFQKMAPLIMRESANMHATMLDSWPPIIYLKEPSFAIMRKIHELNSAHGKYVAAYTFDAGPNAHVYTTKRHENDVIAALRGVGGVKRVLSCGIGDGTKISENHLF